MPLFKSIRVLILLTLLLGLAFYAQQQKLKSRNWTEPLQLVIYPINAENGNPAVDGYIRELDDSVFAPIDSFFAEQSQDYNLITRQPTVTKLGPAVTAQPPPAPLPNAGYAAIIWWGLKFRYWVYQNTPDSDSNIRRIRVFVQYHAAGKDKRLRHSLGLDKGLVALVQAFAAIEQDRQNNIVIAHEVLHTVGAAINTRRTTAPCSRSVTRTQTNRRSIRSSGRKSWPAVFHYRQTARACPTVWPSA